MRCDRDLSLVAAGTLTVWVGCLIVGIVGLVFPHQPQLPTREAPPVQAVWLDATLNDAAPQIVNPAKASVAARPTVAPPPPMSASAPPPSAAPLLAVAEPSPAISFAVPTKLSNAPSVPAIAAPVQSAPLPRAPPTPVRRLTYGQGEGAQPAPAYPREAIVAQQQGTVLVRFDVDESGRVISAEVAKPCPFALLNQAALRAVGESWRFKNGQARAFEVAIQFQLQ